ncbi:SO_0444 family Cu/Zn efflux transporter [Hydrogenimonas sp.]
MDLPIDFFTALWELTGAMAPYILFGLFFAGLLHEWLPNDFIQKHLGRDNLFSVFKATLFGIPLPVCSCGVIPLAASLKKEGASRGSVLSFLISTPITGVDSILATFGMFGWIFTIYRVLTSIVIAFVAGILSNFAVGTQSGEQTGSGQSLVFVSQAPKEGTGVFSFAAAEPKSAKGQVCGGEECCGEKESGGFSFAAAMRYGFSTLMADIAKPLLWGLLIGAAITVAIPENIGDWLSGYSWIGYLFVIAIAVPMYVCATASLPIAASLVLSGVSLGAAFVFLSAGPATNTVTIGVVKRMLGTKSLIIYLVTIIAGSLLFGISLDLFFDSMQIDPRSVVHLEEHGGWFSILSSLVLWALIIWFVLGPVVKRKGGAGED